MDNLGVPYHIVEQEEYFQFGAGDPQHSESKALLPSGIGGKCLILGSSELVVDIPFLGSPVPVLI